MFFIGPATGSSRCVHAAEELVRPEHARNCLRGLDHDRVTRAVRKIRPGGVDASSGLEREPGIKDSEKVAAFVTRALEALEALDSLETMESFESLEDLEG